MQGGPPTRYTMVLSSDSDREELPPGASVPQGSSTYSRSEDQEKRGEEDHPLPETPLKEAATEFSPPRSRALAFQPGACSTERKMLAPEESAEWNSNDKGSENMEGAQEEDQRPRKLTQKSGLRQMALELAPLPQETSHIGMLAAPSVYQVVGEPWDLEGDGLVVFTNHQYRIHNRWFREQLRTRAGPGYHLDEHVIQNANGEGSEGEIVMLNGRNLPYCVVILVPIVPYDRRIHTLEAYRREMWSGLKRGLMAANSQEMRRVMVSVQGLRSADLPWETAQAMAEGGVVDLAKNYGFGFQELVVVIDPKKHHIQRDGVVRMAAVLEENLRDGRPKPEIEKHSPTAGEAEPSILPLTRIKLKEPQLGSGPGTEGYIKRVVCEPYDDEQEEPGPEEIRIKTSPGEGTAAMKPVRIPPLNPLEGEPLRQPQYEDISDPEDEEDGAFSGPVQPVGEYKSLRMGQRRGQKKGTEIFNIERASERMARNITWGPVHAKDGRRTYVPEVGQKEYQIPAEWAQRLEDRVTLKDFEVAALVPIMKLRMTEGTVFLWLVLRDLSHSWSLI
ncbi:uncharacterized protein LOC108166006 [Poecilia reticulata]|uniref:uncharacterized protein LOC108166006 n=1 Tax=Poecilia reticulata TaxID=8081 RepID=UPI0007EB0981|nr:PREDICTED: uncharacterized protein LOC108166006 [Poecilia reticulata]